MGTEPTPQRILLFGASGQLGRELPRTLSALGIVIGLDRSAADFAKPQSLRSIVREHRPDIIVNAAAYTAVDRAEDEPELATTVNGVAPGVLAEEAQALNACLVHYSTDYVFDGRAEAPYAETDAPHPLSHYGWSKWSGERAVAAACPRHLIFRTSWVFSAHGTNFLRTMLRLAAERETFQVVDDQHGTPTSVALIAEVTARVLDTMAPAGREDDRWGMYHLTAAGYTTWHGYARYVIARAHAMGIPLKTRPDAVMAIRSNEFPIRALRPVSSRLSTAKLRASFAAEVPTLPDWRQDVDAVLTTLRSSSPE